MTAPRPALQQRVAAAILDGATRAFALHGEQASMADVAEAAGVARATVYRYFPNREVLVDELARAAGEEVQARLGAARIDQVTPAEGLARAVRALIDVGDPLVLLAHRQYGGNPSQYESQLAAPLRELLERGQAEGIIRRDLPDARLGDWLIGLIVVVLRSPRRPGTDDMTEMILGLFLDGARARGPRTL